MSRDTTLHSTRWGTRGSERAVVVLHGFGADADDLAPLGRALDPAGERDWHFIRAPLELQYGGVAYGRAWFPDTPQEMAQALQGSYFSALEQLDPPGLQRSGQQVLEYIDHHDLGQRTLLIGGFSQGSMVALECVLQRTAASAGLFLLSGGLIAAERTARQARAVRGCRFLQSHGSTDPVLPYSSARALHQTLLEAAWDGELVTFDGGHTVPDQLLEPLALFLSG